MNTACRLLIALAACLPVAVSAAGSDPDWPASCDENQSAMNGCAFQRWQKADARLNVLYGQLAKKTAAEDRPKLQAAQRAWIAYRDLECSFEGAEAEGGTLQPLLISDCRNTLTRQRVADFERLLK